MMSAAAPSETTPLDPHGAAVTPRAEQLFEQQMTHGYVETDRMFAALFVFEWIVALLLAVIVSPYAWAGSEFSIHAHVGIAVIGGLLINSLPLALVYAKPGEFVTRCAIAIAQMLWSAVFIHLSGGRIETHFHIFGSLAFVAFYRDWRVLIPATVVVATDHVLRQFTYPESVYGIANPEWWRFIEHAGWVVFEDVVLVWACLRGTSEVRDLADRQAKIEALSATEAAKSQSLDQALRDLRSSQEAIVRAEKEAAIQLAASVGHELRNPLAAISNAHVYVTRRITKGGDIAADPRVAQFNELISKEILVMGKLISDLLDFARERSPTLGPCPLRPLVSDAVAVVPAKAEVVLVNSVAEDLPIPSLDHDQFRQVIANLVQNASEAMPAGRPGRVEVTAEGGAGRPFQIRVIDDGVGMAPDVVSRIFLPLFTTKTKGTGLGLAIVASIVARHKGSIVVASTPGQGTTFTIELPATSADS